MASGSETIYIKADRNIEVTKPDVTLGDVLKISCVNPSVAAKVKSLRLLRFHHTDKKHSSRIAVSILKVVECIQEVYPMRMFRTWVSRILSSPMKKLRRQEESYIF